MPELGQWHEGTREEVWRCLGEELMEVLLVGHRAKEELEVTAGCPAAVTGWVTVLSERGCRGKDLLRGLVVVRVDNSHFGESGREVRKEVQFESSLQTENADRALGLGLLGGY